MNKAKYLVMILLAVAAVTVGAHAQTNPAAAAKPDSTVSVSTAAVVQTPRQPQPSLNRQAGVGRTTKKTNWSKIKTLFE